MSYTPHLRREGGYTYGGCLKHYRTKGSRNGYSNDPNYKPVGQRAQGRLIDGRYVYEGAKEKSSNRLNGNNGVIYEKRIKEKIIPEKRTFEKRTPSPSKPIRTQPQPKQNWFQRGVSSVGKAATSAGNWLGDRGRDAGKAVGSAASNAGRSIGKAATNAGNWIGDRGRDAGKAIGKAASDTKKWAGDRAKDVGKAVGKAGADVKDWATGGQQHRQNAQKARYDSKYQQEYGFEKNTDKYDNTPKGLITGGKYGYTGKDIREASEASANRSRALDKKARDEQEKYNKSAAGMLENAKGVMSGYTKNVRKAISEHGDKWIKSVKPKNIIDRFTGNSYKESADKKKNILSDLDNHLKPESKKFWKGLNGVKESNYLDSEYGHMRKQAKLLDEQYENAPRQKLSRAKDNASKWISDRFGEAKTTAKKAGEAVGSAASKAGEAVGKAAKDTWEFTKPGGTLDRAAVDTAKKTAKNVKGFVTGDSTKTADQEYDSAKSAAKSVNKAGTQKMKKVLGESRDRYYDAFDDTLSKNTNRHNERAHANTIKKNSTDKLNSLIEERDEKLKKAQDGREKTYIRNQYGEKIDDAKKEARINVTEANRKSSQAGKDFEQAKSNIKKVRRQNAINEAKAENEIRISNVEANRRAAQARKEKEEAHNRTLPGMISNTSKAASDLIDNIVYGKNKKKSKKK